MPTVTSSISANVPRFDLLDTQNELFNAQLAQVNADADLSLCYMRSYAGMGRLLEKAESETGRSRSGAGWR